MIKLLLCAYIDSINAQDINCCNIAKYIDKNRFEVHAFTHGRNIDIPQVICHPISNRRGLKNMQKLWKMFQIKADVYYLPRIEKVDILFARFCRRRMVSSVEIQTVYESPIYKEFFNQYVDGYFCISNYLGMLNQKYWGKSVPILYLGVPQMNKPKVHAKVERIVFVGSITSRKRPWLFLELAKAFSSMEFKMIGDGELLETMKEMAASEFLSNITFTGRISNEAVMEELMQSDVLAITSDKEGLPKVVLEAASCGVVPIYINEYYSIDYIENGINGYGVKNVEEMKNVLKGLINDPIHYSNISSAAIRLYEKYTWPNLIGDYEDFFEKQGTAY